jgi:hypothetical protein
VLQSAATKYLDLASDAKPKVDYSLNNNITKPINVVAQLAKARLGEPDCNAAVPGSIPASPTVS